MAIGDFPIGGAPIAGSADVHLPPRTGTVAITQAGDAVASAVAVLVAGAESVTQAADTSAAAGAVAVGAAGSLTQAADASASAGAIGVAGSGSVTSADTGAASGAAAVAGSGSAVEAGDALSGAGSSTVTGSATGLSADTVAALGGATVAGSGDCESDPDIVSCTGTIGGAPAPEPTLTPTTGGAWVRPRRRFLRAGGVPSECSVGSPRVRLLPVPVPPDRDLRPVEHAAEEEVEFGVLMLLMS